MPSTDSSTIEQRPSIVAKLIHAALAALIIFAIAIIGLFIQIRYDYYGKVSVTEAMKFSEQVASAVDAHFLQHKLFPQSISEITLPRAEMGYAPNVSINSASGILTVVIASSEGNFGTFEYIPNPATNQRLQWTCRNISISKKYLPAKCIS